MDAARDVSLAEGLETGSIGGEGTPVFDIGSELMIDYSAEQPHAYGKAFLMPSGTVARTDAGPGAEGASW
jgi:hypothetical protein